MSRATLFLAKVGLFFASVVILFSAVEIGAFFVRRAVSFAPRPETRDMSASSVYQGRPWAEQFWREENIAFNREKYWPFVVWMAPFTGSTIVINGDGVRRTFHSHCGDPTAYTIWMFGGSTMLGQGVPDWFTIPSLVAELYEKAGRPACVVNEGELGWANTQEVIELMLKLKRAKRKPNLVIFYDAPMIPPLRRDAIRLILTWTSSGFSGRSSVMTRGSRGVFGICWKATRRG